MIFWEIVGAAVLVVAAVALIVVTGGAALAAMGAMAAAASAGTLTVGAAIVGGAGILAEVAGVYFTAKALIDYSQDGNEEALFKGVALGFLFLGAGKLVGKGLDMYQSKRAANAIEHVDEVIEVLDDVPYDQLKNTPPCFLAGTLVKTPKGEIEIEKLTLENTVLVYDFREKCIKEKRILKLYDNWTYRYFEIKTIDNAPILATGKHLFWVENYKKWIPAKELTVGLELKDAKNKFSSILSIDIIDNVDVPTYNLEVEGIHNYFVGQFGLLVHNSNEPSLFESTATNNVEIYTVTDNATGKVVYVGQTVQGKDVRIGQHVAEGGVKANWDNPDKFTSDVVDSGNWTPYEAHVWEQHHLEKNGGKTNLLNKKNPITKAKYDKFGHLHNPCK